MLQSVSMYNRLYSKRNMVYGDPMPELTINTPYVHSNTCTMGNPMPESTVPQLGTTNLASWHRARGHCWNFKTIYGGLGTK
jgi:hypothetical protein